MTTPTQIHQQVQKNYAEVARAGVPCCSPSNTLYPLGTLQDLPADIANFTAGNGDPVTPARLQPGETVLDLGSGGGLDCFLAARQVGESGRVIGVDMTPEMIERARLRSAWAPRTLSSARATSKRCRLKITAWMWSSRTASSTSRRISRRSSARSSGRSSPAGVSRSQTPSPTARSRKSGARICRIGAAAPPAPCRSTSMHQSCAKPGSWISNSSPTLRWRSRRSKRV